MSPRHLSTLRPETDADCDSDSDPDDQRRETRNSATHDPGIESDSIYSVLYGVCVAVGTLVTVYRYQLRSAGEILGKLVVVAAVAGLIVILYAVAAYLGARRIKREISE